MIELLDGMRVVSSGRPGGPAHRAARALERLGARVELRSGEESLATTGTSSAVVVFGDTSHPIEAQYAGLLGAIRWLDGGGIVEATEVQEGLTEGMVDGSDGPGLVRCRDGWIVARWRERGEADLLEAVLGRDIESSAAADCWAAARQCRLLVAPVLSRPRFRERRPIGRAPRGAPRSRLSKLRVVDWGSLWAGPWAAARLADQGAEVASVHLSQRPDGLTLTAAGRRLLTRWNRFKSPIDADARSVPGRRRLQQAISAADLLITNCTPRVLPQLGFDEEWFQRHAPHVSRVSIVSYEHPFTDSPGLGEQASAVAGLLWRGAGEAPDPPRPWADPLAGAEVLLVVKAWEHANRPPGLNVQVSLEGAAFEAAPPVPY
jgi:CoA transferase family III